MKKEELLRRLQKSGIPRSAYFTDGNVNNKDDAYGVVCDNGAFHVCCCERGEPRFLKKFAGETGEEDAYDFLYSELMRTVGNNRSVVVMRRKK